MSTACRSESLVIGSPNVRIRLIDFGVGGAHSSGRTEYPRNSHTMRRPETWSSGRIRQSGREISWCAEKTPLWWSLRAERSPIPQISPTGRDWSRVSRLKGSEARSTIPESHFLARRVASLASTLLGPSPMETTSPVKRRMVSRTGLVNYC